VDEFDRQLGILLGLGVPELAGTSRLEFEKSLDPLRKVAATLARPASVVDGGQAFLIVPDLRGQTPAPLVPLMRLGGSDRPGILDRNHGELGVQPYQPLPELEISPDLPYLLVDIDRGDAYRGIRPRDAVAAISQAGRSPLTITEGILLQLVRPDLLQPNRCFMLAGSRRGDKRVPALWISQGSPKLGWCWEGNPHTWLGTASAAGRLKPTANP
jgi:hypothetical protein